ncbi:MAG: hemerythrin domain-containing protein [Pyrinomonadaceae bacterium]
MTSAVSGIFAPSEPNAIDLLKADHRLVEELFERVKANENGDNSEVFRRIKQELDTHAHIEETIFYPFLLQNGDKDLERIVREGIEEHRQVKAFLAELAASSGESEGFKAKIKVLMEDVEHHVEEEEDEMFSLAEDQISASTLEMLGVQMEREKSSFRNASSQEQARATSMT